MRYTHIATPPQLLHDKMYCYYCCYNCGALTEQRFLKKLLFKAKRDTLLITFKLLFTSIYDVLRGSNC